jgi:hypothetical protein
MQSTQLWLCTIYYACHGIRQKERKESVVIRTSLFVLLGILIFPALVFSQTAGTGRGTGGWNQHVARIHQVQNQFLPQVNIGMNVSRWNTSLDRVRRWQDQHLPNINRQVNISQWNERIRQARLERERIRARSNPPFPFTRSYRNIKPFGSITNNLHRLRRR